MIDGRMTVRVLGRVIGTADGWDEVGGGWDIQFGDFKPADGVAIESGSSLYVNYDDDFWELYGADDEVINKGSLISLVAHLPKSDEY